MKKYRISEMKTFFIWVMLTIGLILTACPIAMANPPGWRITQLTDNNYDEYKPQISGLNIVWLGDYGGNDEVFFYDGTVITQLTDNSYDDCWSPTISGSNVICLWNTHRSFSYLESFFIVKVIPSEFLHRTMSLPEFISSYSHQPGVMISSTSACR